MRRVIVGQSGSGKTRLVRALAVRFKRLRCEPGRIFGEPGVAKAREPASGAPGFAALLAEVRARRDRGHLQRGPRRARGGPNLARHTATLAPPPRRAPRAEGGTPLTAWLAAGRAA